MSLPIAISRHQGMEALVLKAPDGAQATLLLHGGHVLSWVPVGGDEQLYLSPTSAFATGQAVRGGVPVIFPQFGARGQGPRHGFARSRPWQLVSAEQGKDDAMAVLRLVDDDASRLVWPHRFELELCVRVAGRSLEMELACENQGETTMEFSTALHTYLRVGQLSDASLQGLSGVHYWDAVAGREQMQRTDLLLPGSPGLEDLDRIYYQAKQDLLLKEHGISRQRQLLIRQQGFEDVVVWNPGAEKCAQLSDMPDEDYQHMLCVEAATIERPVQLPPGETWVGMQSLILL